MAREEEGWVDFFKYALDYKDEEQPSPSIGAFYHNSFRAYGNALREMVTTGDNGDVISDSVEVARKTMGLMGRNSSIRKYSITKDVKDLFDAYQEFLPYKDRDENDDIGITAANLFDAKCQSVRMRQELKGLQESDGYDTERASNLYLLVDHLSGYIEAESKVLKYSIRGESDSVQNDEQASQENARKLRVASMESYRVNELIKEQNGIYSAYNTPTDSS